VIAQLDSASVMVVGQDLTVPSLIQLNVLKMVVHAVMMEHAFVEMLATQEQHVKFH
jgi:hypothetical protein